MLLYRQQLLQVVAATYAQRRIGSGAVTSERSDSRTMDAIMQESFQKECAQRCLQTAKELIELIHTASKTNETGAWWWNGLCKLIAAVSDKLHLAKCRRYVYRGFDYNNVARISAIKQRHQLL